MALQHYFNGEWVPEEKLLISARDLSVVRGFGVFDFLRTYQGKPFELEAHIDRFYRSAGYLELPIPLDKHELTTIVNEGITRNSLPETGVRLTLTGGVASDAYAITPGKPSLIVSFGPIVSPEPRLYKTGGKVITTPHVRHIPQAKSLNYLVAVLAHREAKKVGAVEAVYMDAHSGRIYEGTIANLFVVQDGVVITPRDDVLIGMTRNVVLDLCKKLDIPSREENLYAKELQHFQEMFITGTTKEVMPIVQFDETTIGDGKVGPVTRRLVEAFGELIGRE
ncbi:MAG TPA: aminotransferase class IV [Candidatus Saccharimonadales bacterium]|nr:aminotransferase class IV [Candidatus Saccharimonadales bacterium]